MELLINKGVKVCLELGPGKVLRGLIQRIDRSLKVVNIGNSTDFLKLKEALGGQNEA